MAQNLANRLKPPGDLSRSFSGQPLGTDALGRDLLAWIAAGMRTSLAISVSASILSALVGVGLGIVAGYFGGFSEGTIMRLVDVQLALPTLLLAMIFMIAFPPSSWSVIIVLSVAAWAQFCRLVRGQVLSLKEREFIEAARAIGASNFHIVRRHILPNLANIVIVLLSLQMPRFVLAEAALSFLGIGVPPTEPSLGGVINSGRDYMWNAWWIVTFPGLTIMLLVSAMGLLGDWIRDLTDPRLRT
jgi:peptide/nickel transport system permease protein